MKKLAISIILGLALLLSVAGGALAVTNGQPDGNNHPYVGLLVFDDADGPAWRCSGSLIAPTVVLTAGHCTDGAVKARVWFNSMLQNEAGTYLVPDYPAGGVVAIEGTPFTNPKYRSPENPYGGGNGLPAFSFRDTGIVVLDKPVTTVGFAALPEAGLVDTLKNKTPMDFVGYGVQYQAQTQGYKSPQPPPYYWWVGLKNRMYAPSELVSGQFVFSAEYLKLAMNPGGGSGGTCFGDSGGPDLLGGTNTVLGVNSFVTNVNCSGIGYSARVDVPETLTWIQSFLP